MGLLEQISFLIDRLLGEPEQPEQSEAVVGYVVAVLDRGRLTSVSHGYGIFGDAEEADAVKDRLEATAARSRALSDKGWAYIVLPVFPWDAP